MAEKQESVRALVRGLDILRYLNSRGSARPAEVAAALDIPRPPVYRLLQTMEEAGYVLFSASDSRARVSPLASGLGDNSSARSLLCRTAAPKLIRFTDEHSWPLDLSVYADLRMVVEETTHWRSPVSIDHNMAGASLPMLRTSAGRAYLAFCDPKEREIILDLLRAENHPKDRPFLETVWAQTRLQQFHDQGHATRGPQTLRAETSSLAVPVMFQGQIAGCLSLIWISSAISMADARDRFSGPLSALSQEISTEMAENRPESPR